MNVPGFGAIRAAVHELSAENAHVLVWLLCAGSAEQRAYAFDVARGAEHLRDVMRFCLDAFPHAVALVEPVNEVMAEEYARVWVSALAWRALHPFNEEGDRLGHWVIMGVSEKFNLSLNWPSVGRVELYRGSYEPGQLATGADMVDYPGIPAHLDPPVDAWSWAADWRALHWPDRASDEA